MLIKILKKNICKVFFQKKKKSYFALFKEVYIFLIHFYNSYWFIYFYFLCYFIYLFILQSVSTSIRHRVGSKSVKSTKKIWSFYLFMFI